MDLEKIPQQIEKNLGDNEVIYYSKIIIFPPIINIFNLKYCGIWPVFIKSTPGLKLLMNTKKLRWAGI